MPDLTSSLSRTGAPPLPSSGAATHVADAVALSLAQVGIDTAIGLDDPQPLFAALRQSPLRVVMIHDERSGAFAADGYARATNRPALCAAVAGPGATNLASGLLEAFRASSPMLAVIGEPKSPRPGVRGFQGLEHDAVLQPVCKAVIRIDDPANGPAAVEHAAALACTGRPGPVVLLVANALWSASLPADVSVDQVDGRASVPISVDGLAAATSALLAARRPIIVAGGGAVTAEAREPLTRLAEALQAPVATTLLGKGAIDETHPGSAGVVSGYTSGASGHGRVALELLGEADTILVLGSDLDPITTVGGTWPRADATLIRVDIDPAEVTTHPGIQILGDARSVTEGLCRSLERSAGDTAEVHARRDWLARASTACAEQRARVEAKDASAAGPGVWPGALAVELDRQLAPGDAIVTDASYSSAWALDRVRQTSPQRTVLAPRGSGVLGWGLPAALGVKLGRLDSRVTCLTGDGGLYFSLAELESAVRLSLPLTLVLLDNRSYGFQRHADKRRLGYDNADLRFAEHVDYGLLARAFGWRSSRVTDMDEFAAAYADALASDEPTFLDVDVDPDVFPPLVEFDR